MKTKLLTICLLLFTSQVFAKEECKGTDFSKWDNCYGTNTNSNGTKYVGEFKKGKRHGQGTLTFSDGEQYVGEFKNNTFLFNSQDLNIKYKKGWVFKGKTIHPYCFVEESASSNNYEDYEELNNIKNVKDFRKNPGKYFVEPKDSLGFLLNDCQPKNEWINSDTFAKKSEHIQVTVSINNGRHVDGYDISKKINLNECKKLSPNINGKCVEAYQLLRYSQGGTLAFLDEAIYGIFKDKEGSFFMLPLKRF